MNHKTLLLTATVSFAAASAQAYDGTHCKTAGNC